MTIHKLEIQIIGRDNASGPISGVRGALGQMGIVAGGIIAAGIFEKIGQGLLDMAAGSANFVKEATLSAARVQEMGAVLSVLAKNAGVSQETVDGMVSSVKDLGITTQVAQNLTANFVRWQLDSADATKLARLAQDAAVISMQDSSEALSGLMHGITTMNTRVLRTYGITLASTIEPQEAYAASLGKTRDQLTANEKIQAVLNAVLDQGPQIAGAYEAAMDTAGKQMRSMRRHVVELLNSFGAPLLDAFTMAIKGGTNFLKLMRDMAEEGRPLNRIATSLGRIFSAILGRAFSIAGDNAAGFEQALDLVADILEQVAVSIENLVANIPDIDFGAFVDSVRTVLSVGNALIQYFAAVLTDGDALNDWLTHLPESWQGPIQAVGTFIANIRNWVEDNFPVIRQKIIDALGAVRSWIEANWPPVRDRILEVVEAIRAWFVQNWPIIQAVALTVWEVIKANILTAVDTIRPAVEGLIETFQRVFTPDRIEAFGSIFEAVGLAIRVAAVALGAIIQVAFAIIVAVIKTAIEWLDGFLEGFGTWLDGFREFWGGITALWEDGALDLEAVVNGLKTMIIGAFDALFGNVIERAKGFIDTIVGFFADLRDRLIGRSIIPDMISGIVSAFSGMDIADAVEGALSGAIDTVRQAAGDIVSAAIPDIPVPAPAPAPSPEMAYRAGMIGAPETHDHWHLTVNSQARSEDVPTRFRHMQMLARRRR